MLRLNKSILKRIYAHGRGWVFVSNDFLDLERGVVIRKVLGKLTNRKTIRRIARGLYCYPESTPSLGEIPASVEQITKAVARKYSLRIQHTGAKAANYLGLSLQVPARPYFLTDGSNRTLTVGGYHIVFKKTALKYMAASQIGGLVIQALRYLGKDNIEPKDIESLKAKLSPKAKKELLQDISIAPEWIGDIIRKINSL